MIAVADLARDVGVAPACQALEFSRATWYRQQAPKLPPAARPVSSRALSPAEGQHALGVLHSEPFADLAPPTVVAILLDRGEYLCSARTMYRLLASAAEVRERRNQLRHPVYRKPELLAVAPNQLWSWDITKLRGPVTWTYFYLYVILDVFSRKVVGWMIAERESAELAHILIEETCRREKIDRSQLVLHSDRGSPMKSHSVAQLLANLDVARSLSRPHVSNDNPFSESLFKTLKYCPTFPPCFGSLEDARAFCRKFFDWYNNHHRHSGIAWLTPGDVHHGRAPEVLGLRQIVLNQAYAAHPERFVRRPPTVAQLPKAVWINPPAEKSNAQDQPGATIPGSVEVNYPSETAAVEPLGPPTFAVAEAPFDVALEVATRH
jgi:putative transposase